MEKHIAQETFTSWVRAPEAARILGYEPGSEAVLRAIVSRLSTGSICAAARSAHYEFLASDEYVRIPPAAWQQWKQGIEQHPLWTIGDMQFDSTIVDSEFAIPFGRYEELRFDKEGVDALRELQSSSRVTSASPAVLAAVKFGGRAPQSHAERPQIPLGKLKRTISELVSRYGDSLREEDAGHFARGAHPEYHVSRGQLRTILREIRGETKRGPKPIRHK